MEPYKEIFTLHDGSKVESIADTTSYKVIAKKLTTKNLIRYYLKEIHGRVINPAETTVADMRKDSGNMVEVPESVYELYHKIIAQTSKVSFNSIQNLMSN